MAKRVKASGGGKSPDDDYGDRLSRLPDCIISHILSFLSTKFAVATSILSTRWRYIYQDFNSFDFDDPTPFKANKNISRTYNANFMEFVKAILLQSKANSVSEFRPRSLTPIKSSMLNSWIFAMLSRDVKVLDIWCPHFISVQVLPCQIFSQKTLVVLKLSGQRIKLPELNFLPNLKVLHLDNMNLLAGNDKGWEISEKGYPLLEDLRITNLTFIDRLVYFTIRLTALIKLTWTNIRATGQVDPVVCHFDAPNLRYLENDFHWVREQSLLCSAQNRETRVHNSRGSESELEYVRRILQQCSMLELVSLTAAADGMAKGWPYSVTNKLIKFSRCSSKCEL